MRRNFKKAAAVTMSALMAAGMIGVIPAAAEEEETIKVMVWDRGNAAPGTTSTDNTMTKWIQEQVKEQLNINVEYVSVPRSGSDEKLNVMMAGGQAPDIVFTYDQGLFYNFASLGGLADLTEAYENYGQDIQENQGDIQNMANLDGVQYGIMKKRGVEMPRHVAYIRQDWLDALGMEVPATKEELIEYLYAVKEKNPGNVDNVIPWAMSGKTDTEKMYLNFVGSYVNFESEKDAYIYSEAYVAVAPGALDGIKQLNTLYNDGLISQDFATDTTEDIYKAQMSAGNAGFTLTDATQPWDMIKAFSPDAEERTFVPVQCFELEDGSYRMPFEYKYAMFVMVPAVSQDKADACMKYLNWMSDPAVAENIMYGPEHEVNEAGVPIPMTTEEAQEGGYPGTMDDLNIVNNHLAYNDDPEAIVYDWATNVNNSFEKEDWFKMAYDVMQVGKFRYPTFPAISEAEAENGSNIKTKMIEYVYRLISCKPDEFDSLQETLYGDMVNAGLQDILDARAEYYDSVTAE